MHSRMHQQCESSNVPDNKRYRDIVQKASWWSSDGMDKITTSLCSSEIIKNERRPIDPARVEV